MIRYQSLGISWLENFNLEKWSLAQKQKLFLILPFKTEVWMKANELLGEKVEEYWKNVTVNPWQAQGDFLADILLVIKKLLENNRPLSALNCIWFYYYKKNEILKKEAIQALLDILSTSEVVREIDVYNILEIVKILQNDPEIDEKELFKIEWAYFPLLKPHNKAEPKLLMKYLSQNPEFFIELIQLTYRSKKQNNETEHDETKETLALKAWELLEQWNRPPGKLEDGSFSGEFLKQWYREVKEKTLESGHYEFAMHRLGEVLFYTDPDPSGLWINLSAAELLDEKENEYIRKGFKIKAYNSRGFFLVDPSGNSEREIANSWRKKAEEIEKHGFIYFASSLKELANQYYKEAETISDDF